jgi:hypothetical protein
MEQVTDMSIEFEANIENELLDPCIVRLKACILADTPFKLGRESGEEFGLVKPEEKVGELSDELLTVSITKHQVYVAFHACTRRDREAFLEVVSDCLLKEGIPASFEEL